MCHISYHCDILPPRAAPPPAAAPWAGAAEAGPRARLPSLFRVAPPGFAAIAIGLSLTLIHLVSIPVAITSVNAARSTGAGHHRRGARAHAAQVTEAQLPAAGTDPYHSARRVTATKPPAAEWMNIYPRSGNVVLHVAST